MGFNEELIKMKSAKIDIDYRCLVAENDKKVLGEQGKSARLKVKS